MHYATLLYTASACSGSYLADSSQQMDCFLSLRHKVSRYTFSFPVLCTAFRMLAGLRLGAVIKDSSLTLFLAAALGWV